MSAPRPDRPSESGAEGQARPVNLLGEGMAEGLAASPSPPAAAAAAAAAAPVALEREPGMDPDADANPGEGAGAPAPRAPGEALSKSQRKNARRRATKKAARAAELEEDNERAASDTRATLRLNHAQFSSMRVADEEDDAAPGPRLAEPAPAAAAPAPAPAAAAASAPAAAPLAASAVAASAAPAAAARRIPANLPQLYPGPPGWMADPVAFCRSNATLASFNPRQIQQHVAHFVHQRQVDERNTYLDSLYAQPGRPKLMNVRSHQALHREAGLVLPDRARHQFPANKLVQRYEAVQAAGYFDLVPPPFVLPSGPGIAHKRTCSNCARPCSSECQCGESYCSQECQIAEWICPQSHRHSCEVISQGNPMALILTKFWWHDRSVAAEEADLRAAREEAEAKRYNVDALN